MPDVYQVSDRKRVNAPVPSREICGLPRDAFVFCSFNNNYKFTPEMFATWMSILKRVPGSVLWLLADNPWAEANLAQGGGEAGRRRGTARVFAGAWRRRIIWPAMAPRTCSSIRSRSMRARRPTTRYGCRCRC